jgi:hypothetical protein
MLLGGLWHGAGWTYVFWGGLHGSYLAINHMWRSMSHRVPHRLDRLVSMISWPLTFLAVVIAWVFFRASDFTTALNVLQGMAWQSSASVPGELAYLFGLRSNEYFGIKFTGLGMSFGDVVVGATFLAISYSIIFYARNTGTVFSLNKSSIEPTDRKALMAAAIGVLAWLSCFAVIGSSPSEFIYFQF